MKLFFTYLIALAGFSIILSCEKENTKCQKITFYEDADGDSLVLNKTLTS